MKNSFLSLLSLIGMCAISNAQNIQLSNDTNASPVVNDYLYVQPNGSGLYSRAFGLNGSNELYIGSVEQTISNIRFFNKGTGTLMTLTPNGNVGVGTDVPLGLFHAGDNTGAGIVLDNRMTSLTSKVAAQIGWAESSFGTAGDLIIAPRTNVSAATRFFTNNGSTIEERMRINGNGNVGIGVSNPGEWKLALGGMQHTRIMMKSNTAGLSNEVATIYSNSDETEAFEVGLDNDGLNAFHIGNKYLTVKHMTVNSSGKVGLGTPTPSEKLDIRGAIAINDDENDLPFKIWAGGSGTSNHMRIGTDYGHYGDAAMEIYQDYQGGAEQKPGKVLVNGDFEAKKMAKMGAHYENLVSFGGMSTPANGYKIKTNIPFASGIGMYNIDIHGYHYGNKSPIGLDLTFYVWAPAGTPPNFVSQKISSSGDWTPDVQLAVENGKIVIIIPEPGYYVRFGVSAFAPWNASQSDDYFKNWQVIDEAIVAGTTDVTDVSYENSFGTVTLKEEHSLNVKDTGGTERRTLFNQVNAGNTLYLGHIDANWGNSLQLRAGTRMVFSVNNSTGNLSEAMRINTDGKVGIGTTTTGTHKLAVEGSVGAREVMVEAPGTGWSDFVFESDYNLPTLQEVEKHIQDKGHLKDIPSATDVEENGFYLGEMDSKLLQKIEELTLYTIAQEKKIESLENHIKELKAVNDKLLEFQQRLEKIEQNQNK